MDKTYICVKCGKRKEAASAPDCCRRKMKPVQLDACTTAFSAEQSRPMQDDEPCDDSRG